MPGETRKLPSVVVYHPDPRDKVFTRRAKESLDEARRALALARPSVFLGQRHYDPFPPRKTTSEAASAGLGR
jgi:hypothetical protein